MNLRIGICDDELEWRKKVENILEIYGKQQEMEITTVCFRDSYSVSLYEGAPFHIFFVDIGLDGESGIDLACSVNVKWPDCQIVYLTKQLSYAVDVYRSQHIYFVLKEEFEVRFQEVMDKVRHQLRIIGRKIVLTVQGGKKIAFKPEDILYFEREERITRIVTRRGEYITSDKIGEVMEKLPKIDFVRCHYSYIVYLPAVEKYVKNIFVMRDGRKILISRGYKEQTREAFNSWAKMQ